MILIINLLRTYWRIILPALILTLGLLYVKGLQSDCVRYKATIALYEATAIAQLDKNKQTIAEQQKITADVVQSYSDSVNKLKDYYAKNPNIKFRTISVLSPATSSGQMSSHSTASKTVDDTAEGINPSTSGTSTINDANEANNPSVLDCASDVLQLLNLQDWVKKQSSVQ